MPSVVPLCGKGIYIRWQHLIFIIMYIVQLYKDWTILHMLGCRDVALPSTKQIVQRYDNNLLVHTGIFEHSYKYCPICDTDLM